MVNVCRATSSVEMPIDHPVSVCVCVCLCVFVASTARYVAGLCIRFRFHVFCPTLRHCNDAGVLLERLTAHAHGVCFLNAGWGVCSLLLKA